MRFIVAKRENKDFTRITPTHAADVLKPKEINREVKTKRNI
jgi:hypothetical protein